MSKGYLYFTVFSAGLVALAVELSASRLVGSVFGVSNLVWATIIGLILVYLAAGYLLGGAWADRSPRPITMFSILAWAAFAIGWVPFIARPILRTAADAFDHLHLGVLFGSFCVILILLAIPVTLLGMISPFALRLALRDLNASGKTAGDLYAVSTLGSFIGTFLPPLLMIPLLGTRMTFLFFSLYLVGVALAGLGITGERRRFWQLSWMPVVIVVLMFTAAHGSIKASQGQIYETESAYNYIQVLEINGFRLLRLNEGQGFHSIWHSSQLDYQGPWEQFLVAPFFNPATSSTGSLQQMAIVGLAAGTTARQASEVFGPVEIDGFEIDPAIVQVGRQFFGMNQPNLNVIEQDGRFGLAHSDKEYQLIVLDAYRPPYIPWHLTTREFFQEVKDHLTDDGVVAMNVGSDPGDRRLIEGLAGTLRAVFPSVYMMEVPGTFNFILYATRQPTRIENLKENYLALAENPATHPLLLTAMQRTIAHQQAVPHSRVVFSDDHAPVEWITNSMVLNYIFSGNLEMDK
jgi:spermidine synthase